MSEINQKNTFNVMTEEFDGINYVLQELKNQSYLVKYNKYHQSLVFIDECKACGQKHFHGKRDKKEKGSGDGPRVKHCIPFHQIMENNKRKHKKNRFIPKYYHNSYTIKEV